MKSKGAIAMHVIFWLIMLAIVVIDMLVSEHTVKDYIITDGIFGLLNVSIFYINYIILIPELIQKRKKYWLYILAFLLLVLATAAVKTVFAALNPEDLLQGKDARGKIHHISLNMYAVVVSFISGFFLVSSCIIKFSIDWFSNERVQRNLESEKKDMELQFLKSQLNPHFLFNSLNNIYSLAYQKSDKTADAILKLSEIMRYMIYESNDSWVALSKEVEYVQSYIELHKLRFKDGAAVEITLNGEIDGQQIVPLILISFVENAFKHGVANDPENPIKINIIANQKILHFSVSNKKNKTNKDAMGGVGLNNVERRLQLLYPDRYKLNIVNSATHYTTELMLDL
ncbi:sensor histidine kinase [Pedobacter namyangjuensis]|uniref:sensor histidine kinase n=1 Tax=Pedobacter namyangjuensis TaxID=600626 RepID=UPI000DE2BEB3|nr:sensor histidine kinase [Pedobacter namyangjuensis]